MRSKSQDTDKFRPFTGGLEHGAYVAAGVCYLGFFFGMAVRVRESM